MGQASYAASCLFGTIVWSPQPRTRFADGRIYVVRAKSWDRFASPICFCFILYVCLILLGESNGDAVWESYDCSIFTAGNLSLWVWKPFIQTPLPRKLLISTPATPAPPKTKSIAFWPCTVMFQGDRSVEVSLISGRRPVESSTTTQSIRCGVAFFFSIVSCLYPRQNFLYKMVGLEATVEHYRTFCRQLIFGLYKMAPRFTVHVIL